MRAHGHSEVVGVVRDLMKADIDVLRSAPEEPIEKQAETIRTIADRWEEMRPDQKKRLLATVFREVAMKGGRLESATPHPDWLPYFEQVLEKVPRVELGGPEHMRGTRLELREAVLRRAA